MNGIEYAERVLPIERPKVTAKPYNGSSASADMQGAAGVFNDPYLSKQWHYYNDGSVSGHAKKGADCKCKACMGKVHSR